MGPSRSVGPNAGVRVSLSLHERDSASQILIECVAGCSGTVAAPKNVAGDQNLANIPGIGISLRITLTGGNKREGFTLTVSEAC